MIKTNSRRKTATIIFRGFSASPIKIEEFFGLPAFRKGALGDSVKPGLRSVLKKSYVAYSEIFNDDEKLDRMLAGLIEHLGGINQILGAQEKFNPEYLQIEFDIPASQPDKQQDEFLSPNSIWDIYKLGATLGLSFY